MDITFEFQSNLKQMIYSTRKIKQNSSKPEDTLYRFFVRVVSNIFKSFEKYMKLKGILGNAYVADEIKAIQVVYSKKFSKNKSNFLQSKNINKSTIV